MRYSVSKLFLRNNGSTLIELLMYMGILTIFIGILSGLFGSAVDVQLGSEATSGVNTDANYILNRLIYDIQRAKSVTTPATNGSSSQTLSLNINNSTYTFSKDASGNLMYNDGTGSYQLNSYTSSVSAMTFTKYGNIAGVESTVKINLTVASRVIEKKGQETQTISTTVSTHRN